MTRAEVDRWTEGRFPRVKIIFGRWVCWGFTNHSQIDPRGHIRFAYVGDWSVNWGFAYRTIGGTIQTPNDWGTSIPKQMKAWLERNLPH